MTAKRMDQAHAAPAEAEPRIGEDVAERLPADTDEAPARDPLASREVLLAKALGRRWAGLLLR